MFYLYKKNKMIEIDKPYLTEKEIKTAIMLKH